MSDAQYRLFRSNLFYLAGLLVLHPLLRRAYERLVHNGPLARGDLARLDRRAGFDAGFALLFLPALHGFSALKILLILLANYHIATSLPRGSVPAATWAFNIAVLFANEFGRGYPFEAAAVLLVGSDGDGGGGGGGGGRHSSLVSLGRWLDDRGGLVPRWNILFNITILRLISFNMDYYWSTDRTHAASIEKKQLDVANLSERDRISIPPPQSAFGFRNYLAYTVYAPLYLTGPIITFNDFVSQSRFAPASIETARTVRYGLRFLLALLAMEAVLHIDYVGAIVNSDPDWSTYTASQLSLLSISSLHIIWLKLLLPWRLARLWALVDGVDPPENMVRCVSNNYSALSFWRSWHRSYNRWLTRYLFFPLGGASFADPRAAVRSLRNYVLVFTFVALWHDIKLRLLAWGWLVVLFMMPEMILSRLLPARRFEGREEVYRFLCAAGGVANVIMMSSANLVGFAVGLDGLQTIVAGIFQDFSGAFFIVTTCCAFYIGVLVMFEIRESEMRRGISLRC